MFYVLVLFARLKSFRKKNKQVWNCPDNLIYNTTDMSLCYLQGTMPCQWSSSGLPGVLRIWKSILTLRRFLPCTPSSGFTASLGAGSSTKKLALLHADLRNISPARLFVWITTIHKRGVVEVLFKDYGWPVIEESASCGIRTLFTIVEEYRSLMLYPFDHRVMWLGRY